MAQQQIINDNISVAFRNEEKTNMVKEAAVAWPPATSSIPSTLSQEQQCWQIPPIQSVAEQLMHHAFSNGGPMPPNMYLPAFALTLPQNVPLDSKLLPQMWSSFPQPGPSMPSQVPIPPDNPNKPYLGHYQLTPLSNGGFIYAPANIPPNQIPSNMTNNSSSCPPSPMVSSPYIPSPPPSSPEVFAKIEEELTLKPSMVAQTRNEKIEKYRNKRSSRNWNRQADPTKKAVAQMRARDEMGHFVIESQKKFHEVVQQLELTQKESRDLQDKLSAMEKELIELRRRAVEAHVNEATVKQQLEIQQKLNRSLMDENQFLWKTVPQDELFTTLNPDHAYVDREAYLSKVDLTDVENILIATDSPFLEQARGAEDWEKPIDQNLL